MQIIDGLILSDENAAYMKEIMETMPEENNKPISESDAINYSLATLQVIEKMLTIRDIYDPVDFITGLSEGTILIVKK